MESKVVANVLLDSVKVERNEILPKSNTKKSMPKLKKSIKENNLAPEKQLKKLELNINRKATDPNKHIIRKHLGELYAKIMFKVKEVERKKRTSIPLKIVNKKLEKCVSSKNDLVKNTKLKSFIHKSKKSVQGNMVS